MVSFTDHYNAISIDKLPSKTKTGKDSWYFNNSLLCKPESSSATKTFLFLLKTQKTITLQVTGGNTPNLVLRRMLRYFLKIPPLKKILRLKEDCKTYTEKEQFKPEITPMIKNLQDELYQLETKQAKGAKRRANIT